MEVIEKSEVLKLLGQLLDQAREVKAQVGEAPTADEALSWAIGEIEGLVVHNL